MHAVLVFFVLGIISCGKDEDCFEYCALKVVSDPTSILLTVEQLDSIQQLFHLNHIPLKSNFQFFAFYKDGGENQHAVCYQYVNNMKVFYSMLHFIFDQSGRLTSQFGKIMETDDYSTKPASNQNCVLNKFVQEISNDAHLMNSTEVLKTGCFEVEFGYYDLDIEQTGETRLVKTWRVKLKDSEYPQAYINDSDLRILYYSNGIIIN